MIIVGLDLSLTAPGVASLNPGDSMTFGTLKPKALSTPAAPLHVTDKTSRDEDARLIQLADQVIEYVATATSSDEDMLPSLIVIEGLGFASQTSSAMTRAGLHFLVRTRLRSFTWAHVQIVAPSTLKKFVTGKGNSEKSLMLREVYKRWKCDCTDDNQADAVGLAYIGAALVGEWECETQAQREVIALLKNGSKPAKKSKRKAA